MSYRSLRDFVASLESAGELVRVREPVAAADLAAYDGTEPPDGPDPWAALLGSEDPATSALARWWSPG